MNLRVVFDTSVLLSGIVFGGKPRQCIFEAMFGSLDGILCDEILSELAAKLAIKFNYSEHRIERVIDDLQRLMEIVSIGGSLAGIASDPKDNMVLECAAEGKADYIVSGDRKHLVRLGSYEGIRIVDPATLMAIIGSEGAA